MNDLSTRVGGDGERTPRKEEGMTQEDLLLVCVMKHPFWSLSWGRRDIVRAYAYVHIIGQLVIYMYLFIVAMIMKFVLGTIGRLFGFTGRSRR
jgi:hypothetical protein